MLEPEKRWVRISGGLYIIIAKGCNVSSAGVLLFWVSQQASATVGIDDCRCQRSRLSPWCRKWAIALSSSWRSGITKAPWNTSSSAFLLVLTDLPELIPVPAEMVPLILADAVALWNVKFPVAYGNQKWSLIVYSNVDAGRVSNPEAL